MVSRIKKPVTKGVAKVPVVMQMEALECGAAALAMVMAYYGKWVPLEQVRFDCGVSRNGSKADKIYRAAEKYGFSVKAFGKKPEALRENGTFPCIIFWNMNHFVVLDGFRGDFAYLNDPARGTVKLPWEEFKRSYSGIVLLPLPSEDFKPSGKRSSVVEFAAERMRGAGAAVAFSMLTTAFLYLFGIVNSAASRVFMDRLLTGRNPEWLYPYTALMIVLAAVQIAVMWVQSITTLRLNGKMEMVGTTAMMWNVLRKPMTFFSQRMAGDIQSRVGMNGSMAQELITTFAPLLLNSGMMLVYLVLMLRQSVLLTAIGITVLLLNAALSAFLSKRRVNITRRKMRDEAMKGAIEASGIDMIETIKSSGAEEAYFGKWAGYQARVNTQNMENVRVDFTYGMVLQLLSTLANYAILVFGIILIFEGRYTLGGVMMFQGFLTSFMSPASSFISAGQKLQELRTRMERVDDVFEYPEDSVLQQDASAEDSPGKLGGALTLRNVTFGYSRLEDPVLKDFSLDMKTGSYVALVGASGCGKSTVAKLITGLYQPWEGEILFDGKPRSAYPRETVTGSVAMVDQDIILFEDSVSANIRMWDKSILDFEVIMAARDAQIHDDITRLPEGYRQRIHSGGSNLSGGQKQRLEIARVLAQDPIIIILDEATSALDAVTESRVMSAIRDRGISCLVIAHRLSTVRDCDEIIVLENGSVAERGTHKELIQKGGVYADLIANE